ncbi:MAG: coniferyl aldehyde dehydrogenase [Pseudomonadales bacterium]|nr:coniferyl aldehyde dehydrogenase [Pseudomonadales bacterium]
MSDTTKTSMQELLVRQSQAYLNEGSVSAETRIDRLDRAVQILLEHKQPLCEAMRDDFGHRSIDQSMFTDIAGSVGSLNYAKKNTRRWMKREKRSVQFPLNLLGAKARIEYQPLGVVGMISPWNFPVNLTFAPLAGILSAGNRCMIKPSEFTPATSELMQSLFAQYFDELEIAVVTGGSEVGSSFSSLPFDHLMFTGATSVAKHVMRAAAENLVPLTLELGGKSPVILGCSADVQKSADSIMAGKLLNAGQICLAPDYAMVHEDLLDEFVASSERSVAKMFPTLLDNDDYTSVVNRRHYDRLMSYLEDAEAKGATVHSVNPANEDFTQQPAFKIAPTLIINPDDNMQVMQDEIFGPILPVKTYKNIRESHDYVNAHARPLGLYYFGDDKTEERGVLEHTTSGGVTINDVIMHVSQEELPFGGVGPSGMGAYHGFDGFKTFSHAKSVYTQSKINVAELAGFRPPFGEKLKRSLKGQIGA